jgi:glycosyltransferase involved in cell wall biosynthesis
MKVIVNIESLAPPLTGIGRYTQELLAGLQHHPGIEQVSCFANTSMVDSSFATGDVLSYSILPQKLKCVSQVIRGFPGAYRLRSLIRSFFFRRATRQGYADAVYHEPNFILQPFDGPCVTTIHDLSHIRYPDCHPRERVRYMERELPKTLERATHIITDSVFVKDELVSTLGVSASRISAIPLGVGGQYRPRSAHDVQDVLRRYRLSCGRYLLVVATLEPRKNLQGLITAYMRLSLAVRRRFPLILVGGRGWKSSALEKTIAHLESAGEIRRLGYLPASDLPSIYAGAGAFAFPSHYEGFGLPPLEAMASGVPVLVSGNSSMTEVVGDVGILVNKDDPDSICQGLERLLVDDLFRQKACIKGPERASEFTWAKCVEQTIAVYRKAKGL